MDHSHICECFLNQTYNIDRQVPDSAGTATAYLCGVKANYETLGVNGHVDSREKDCKKIEENSVPSILKWAIDEGKSAGIVTTTRVTHATPGAGYSHVAHRDWESSVPSDVEGEGCKDIARQLIEDEPGSRLQVILGGGRKNFFPSSWLDPRSLESGSRTDGINLIERWIEKRKAQGLRQDQFKFINSTHGLDNVDLDRVEYLLGLFNYSHMAYESDRDKSGDGEPSLKEMTEVAVKVLRKNPKGFLLLVEGGRIDHAHHQNYASTALHETVQFDSAVLAASKLVNTADTILLVTADHAHTLTMNGYPLRGNSIFGLSSYNDSSGQPFTTLMYGNGPGHLNPRLLPDDTSKWLELLVLFWYFRDF